MGATADCDTPQKADIVLRLSNGNYVKFVPGGENPQASKPKTDNQNVASAMKRCHLAPRAISVIDPKPVTPSGRTFERRITQKPQRTCSMACREASTKNKNITQRKLILIFIFPFHCKFSLAIFFISDFASPSLRLSLSTIKLLYSALRTLRRVSKWNCGHGRRKFFLTSLAAARLPGLNKLFGRTLSDSNGAAATAPAYPGSPAQGKRPLIISRRQTVFTRLDKGMDILKNGGDTLDAVVAAVTIVEDDPNDDSVGYGGLPNEEGEVELDASVMHGRRTAPARSRACVASKMFRALRKRSWRKPTT